MFSSVKGHLTPCYGPVFVLRRHSSIVSSLIDAGCPIQQRGWYSEELCIEQNC